MRNFTIYLSVFLCLFFTKVLAQESFESQVNRIADKIEKITKEEKEALKIKVEAVNLQLEKGEITQEKADQEKARLAESSAQAIEFRVTKEEKDLMALVQKKVDGNIQSNDSIRSFTISYNVSDNKCKDNPKRTTTQLVFAVGANNLVTNGSIANSEYLYLVSYFGEWGFSFDTRILNKSNLLHLRYGLSLMKNNLRPSDNQYFVVDGNQTNLEQFPTNLRDSRFKNNYLVIPVYLEFDFAKKDVTKSNPFCLSKKGFRVGFGGYTGFNTKTKQKLYFMENDNKVRVKNKSDFNAYDYSYGIGTYVGYNDISLYCKYDLNPLFEDNPVEQHNISLGLRFDFF